MSFQKVVNRNFTTGFPGEIVRDGPTRAKVVRLTAAAAVARNEGNIVGRVYGYTGEVPPTGSTLAALVQTAAVGGAVYAGVLIHPKHYALQGTIQGGTLAPSLALPNGAEAEVADMAIIVAEVFNPTTDALSVNSESVLGYVTNAILDANDAIGLPFGAIVAFAPGTELPTGFAKVPGIVSNPVGITASAAGAPVSALTIIQLTQ